MSFDALAWAVRSQPGSPADKLVLLGLADRHNTETNCAYPSIKWLEEFSGLYRATVIAALDRLIEKGFIFETGQRVGKTKQVKVYGLKMEQSQKPHPLNSVGFQGKECGKAHRDTSKGTSTSRAKALSVRAIDVDQFIDVTPTLNILTEWAVEKMGWNRLDAQAEIDRFIDNARQHGRKYIDWQAAWRNWCRSPFCKTKPKADLYAYRKEPLRV